MFWRDFSLVLWCSKLLNLSLILGWCCRSSKKSSKFDCWSRFQHHHHPQWPSPYQPFHSSIGNDFSVYTAFGNAALNCTELRCSLPLSVVIQPTFLHFILNGESVYTSHRQNHPHCSHSAISFIPMWETVGSWTIIVLNGVVPFMKGRC